MLRVRTLAAGLLGLASLILVGPVQAGPTYLLTTLDMNWQDAQTEAAGLGGHLAVINDQAEQNLLYSMFGDPNSPAGNQGGFWVGLASMAGNPFAWLNGDAVDYTNWGLDQPATPDNADDVHGFLSVYDGLWYTDFIGLSAQSTNSMYGIIEIPEAQAPPVEEPPAEEPPVEEPPVEEPPPQEPPAEELPLEEVPGTNEPGSLETPEPASLVTLAIGGLSLAGYGWRRSRKSASV